MIAVLTKKGITEKIGNFCIRACNLHLIFVRRVGYVERMNSSLKEGFHPHNFVLAHLDLLELTF